MKINEKYKIKSDENNVIICEKYTPREGKNAGNEQWRPMSFHPNLEFAYRHLLELEINKTELKDIEIVLKAIRDVKSLIREVAGK
ncbi:MULTISPECIES: hypothetical protein [Clostridium]|uniref:hypothetical protein n=1 Tax=Clostridium TaxID=1485 RepID=UPI0023304973|nr:MULTISPECIES: hypothetical protein [Clostridium]MDB2101758.1 hypothetical protein [Clostridium paraputrificum]MDU2108629.1 hypothetical protein [Clostridium sp.]MDU3354843.1 hypothetical protein [Clostridium sp.]